MIQNKLHKALETAREYGQFDKAKILAIVHGEMEDFARRLRVHAKGGVLNDTDANVILKRHLRHAGITLQMNGSDPTAHLVIETVSEFLVEDVMSDVEMRERILESGLSKPREVLKHLNSFGGSVDMSRARVMVKNYFGN